MIVLAGEMQYRCDCGAVLNRPETYDGLPVEFLRALDAFKRKHGGHGDIKLENIK